MGDARILEMSGAFKVGKCPNQVRARRRGRRCDRAGPSRVDGARARRSCAACVGSKRGPENCDDTVNLRLTMNEWDRTTIGSRADELCVRERRRCERVFAVR